MNRFQTGWEQLWSNFTEEQKNKIANLARNIELNLWRSPFTPPGHIDTL